MILMKAPCGVRSSLFLNHRHIGQPNCSPEATLGLHRRTRRPASAKQKRLGLPKFGSRKRKSAKSRPGAIAELQNWLSEKQLNVRQKPIVWRRSRKRRLRPSGRKEKTRKQERKSVAEGKRGGVRGELGGRGIIK